LHLKLLPDHLLTLIFLLYGNITAAQNPQLVRDSLNSEISITGTDTIRAVSLIDTVNNKAQQDTVIKAKKTETIDSPVEYNARDSIVYDLQTKKVYLFGEGDVKYKDIALNASFVEFDMAKELVYARGTTDSTGKSIGKPAFSQGSEKFDSDTMEYNFRTKKGIIKQIFSEQEGGYLHSRITKRQPNNEIDLKDGMYTTCDLPHPHFWIEMTKAKSIPGDKIISGPAYFVIADVPVPIGIPFGFFPTTKTNKSGVLIPQYGEEQKRGFYLRNGGYYLALSDYLDLKLTGDIFTNGTWGARIGSTYRKRYKFSGNYSFSYYENKTGERGIDFSKSKDFAFVWSHSQDSKANPNRRFSANVNFTTGSYDRNHSRNINNVMQSTKQSSINFSKVWPNSPFNFNASANANQNSIDRSMNLRLPSMSLNMNRIYPFRSKNRVGKSKWYDDIQISYSSTLENRLNTYDTLLFKSKLSDFNTAYQHNIPVSLNLKALNYFTISPNLRYTGVIFTKTVTPYSSWDPKFQFPDTDIHPDTFMLDTVQNIRYAHAYVPSLSIDFSPKIFGMFTFREKSRIDAIRHVITPRASFTYTPDMEGKVPNYYNTVIVDSTGKTRTYSMFDESIYRTPVLSGRQGSVSLSLMNNIEMKLKPGTDTAEEVKKIKLLDNLNFSTRYDIFKDSMKWSTISMSGNTSLFKRMLNIRFGGRFDPYSYVVTKNGTRRAINTSLLKDRHQLVRMTNFDFSTSINFKSKQKKSGSSATGATEEGDPTARVAQTTTMGEENFYGQYVDFDIPWSLGVDYNFNYSRTKEKPEIIQSVRIRGDLSLTPKWKIGFNSGYDFTNRKVSMTNLNVYRDLHCWEMQITMVPFGQYRSYSFQINIKSAILRDLKYEQGDNWYDNF
jgi:hypothetical protein